MEENERMDAELHIAIQPSLKSRVEAVAESTEQSVGSLVRQGILLAIRDLEYVLGGVEDARS